MLKRVKSQFKKYIGFIPSPKVAAYFIGKIIDLEHTPFPQNYLEKYIKKIQKEKTIKVKIPKGVDAGSKIRIASEGDAGSNGGPNGDLYIFINVKEHDLFERNGVHLYCEMPITFSQAALGAEIEVPTLEGKAILKVPSGTQTGTKFRMIGKGIKNSRTGETGNLYVAVKIITPTKLSSEQKDLFKKVLEQTV